MLPQNINHVKPALFMNQLNQAGEYTALTVNIQPAASGQDSRDAMMIAANEVYEQAL